MPSRRASRRASSDPSTSSRASSTRRWRARWRATWRARPTARASPGAARTPNPPSGPDAMASASCRWSVVIPALNEADRLPAYLAGVVAYFDGQGEPYEVIVVDDGSTDATADRVREIGRTHPSVQLER